MSVTTETPIATSTANGATTVFPHAFTVLAVGDLKVTKTTSGVVTTATYGVDYTIHGLGTSSGSVTFTSAPANGVIVTRYRDTAIERLTDYQNNGDLPAATLNADLDRPLLLLQEIYNGGKGTPTSIRVPSGELANALPAAASRANRVLAFDSTGQPIAIVGVDSGSAAALSLDLASSAVSKGSKLIAFIQRIAGAVAHWVEDKLSRTIDLHDFLTDAQIADAKAGALSIDCSAGVNAWLLALRTASLGTLVVPYDTMQLRGTLGYAPPGKYRLDSKVTFYENTGFKGAGRLSTIFVSTVNDNIFEMAVPAAYDGFGCQFAHFSVVGDRAKPLQNGIACIRLWESTFTDIGVYSCGKDGFLFRQCLDVSLNNCEVLLCVGNGFRGMDGTNSWVDTTPSNLPSNRCAIWDCHFGFNDAAGILLSQVSVAAGATGCNGFLISNTTLEYNYHSSSAGTGYNCEVTCKNYFPNEFSDVWCEGPVNAHVRINPGVANNLTRFTRLHHAGVATAATYPNRGVIVDSGACWLDEPIGNGSPYKIIAGSIAPFRVNKAGGLATIRVSNAGGSTVTNNQFVEDETGAMTGLDLICRMGNYGEFYGSTTFARDYGVNGPSFYQAGQTFPFAEFSNFYSGLGFGSGTAAVETYLVRKSAHVLGLGAGDTFVVGGINGETLKFNSGTANAAVATTMGNVGPTGSTAGNPLGWLRINVAGVDRFVPYW